MRHSALLAYGVLYAFLLLAMHLRDGFALAEPLFVLGIVGVGFTVLAFWSTRALALRVVPVRSPGPESRTLLLYFVAAAAFITWGLPAVRGLAPGRVGPTGAGLLAKLVVFVGGPLLVWRWRWGYRYSDFADVRRGLAGHWRPVLWMSAALIVFQLVVGKARADLAALAPTPVELAVGIAVGFAWLLLEVGVVEEFFFRALLQARLAAWTRSEMTGVVLMALLFGLAHAPGLYLRPSSTGEALGPHPSLFLAVGYSVVITSVTGFFLGTLWVRTRNLLALAVIHAAGDLLPNLADVIRWWRPGA